MLYHLLLQTVNTQSAGVSRGHPHLLQYHLDYHEYYKEVQEAVKDLSQAASEGSLYVIADEVWYPTFETLCDKLLTQVPRLHIWAASCYHGHAPAGWPVEYLTRPLRSPPAVVREVAQDGDIAYSGLIQGYSERGVPDHTDGPPVRRVYHGGQGHSFRGPFDCVTCGREVASFLLSLRVGVTENVTSAVTSVTSTCGGTTPPCLQWRDVLVLFSSGYASSTWGMMMALEEAGIPVRKMKDSDIYDVATARSDVVWFGNGCLVRGLERKVVVCLDVGDARLQLLSRCTSQLVIFDCHLTSLPDDFINMTKKILLTKMRGSPCLFLHKN
ncbi:uncharacterized protein LOC112568185 [Pomacea canaliculata]|uniref:uncharacterized protein LOC112568185 n=1 Tax=Pomacea canaliculata TaxID=400727 RepID=UPI000D72D088|nr:uncharacterized protein LOC112568185 [Pomacea canaliculata]